MEHLNLSSNLIQFILFSLGSCALMRVLPEKAGKYLLLGLNLVFYFLCSPLLLLLLVGEILWTKLWGDVLVSSREKSGLVQGVLTAASIFPLILILGLYKYYHFFVPDGQFALLLLMPLGISYYSFKMVSYLADLKTGKLETSWDLVPLACYLSFFPQMLCGPIQRPESFLTGLKTLGRSKKEWGKDGAMMILSGLFKKLVIADRLAVYVAAVFADPKGYPRLALWMAAFFFTVQLYCDFAGYSEISIGICRLMGIRVEENFHLPYLAFSVRDFWKRWHISLSEWLRDYVYIPLGGSKKGKVSKVINVLITFLVSGIWHGSGLQFIVWGLWHGIWNLVPVKAPKTTFGNIIKRGITFVIVLVGWIPFGCDSLADAVTFIGRMATGFSLTFEEMAASVLPFTGDYSSVGQFLTVCLFIVLLFVIEVCQEKKETALYNKIGAKGHTWIVPYGTAGLMCFYAVSIILFGMIGQSSFFYANF